jgi:hypothetical protein
MIEQFTEIYRSQTQRLSQNDLDFFFRCCHQYYAKVEQHVKTNTDAIKIMIRMVSILPVNLENIVEKMEAARFIASMILKNLSEKTLDFWEIIIDQEWPSLCQGLVILLCIVLSHRDKAEQMNQFPIFLWTIANRTRRAEVVTQLLNVLKRMKYILTREEMVGLYALIGIENLTVEQLEIAGYLEIYITYLFQILIFNRDVNDQWEQRVREQIVKLLKDRALKSMLPTESFL